MSSGSNPVTTIGVWYCGDDRLIFPRAHHRAHVTGGQESLHDVLGRVEHGANRRRHQHVRHEHREIVQSQALRLHHRHDVGRRGGLKTDREEHDLPVRMLLGHRDGVQRRVDDPHVAAGRLDRQQILLRAGHAQHVAVRTEDHLLARGDGDRLVDHLDRRDAHGTAGPVDQRDLVRAASRRVRTGRWRASARRRLPSGSRAASRAA